jgi:hypothetical protein
MDDNIPPTFEIRILTDRPTEGQSRGRNRGEMRQHHVYGNTYVILSAMNLDAELIAGPPGRSMPSFSPTLQVPCVRQCWLAFLTLSYFYTKMNYKKVALDRYVGATSHRSAIGLLIVTLT